MTQSKLERKINKKQSMMARKAARRNAWEAKGKFLNTTWEED